MAQAGKARVRILDPSAAVVFKRTVDEHSTQGGGHDVMQDGEGTVRLEAGEYRVECIVAGRTHSTSLRVVHHHPGTREGVGCNMRRSGRRQAAM